MLPTTSTTTDSIAFTARPVTLDLKPNSAIGPPPGIRASSPFVVAYSGSPVFQVLNEDEEEDDDDDDDTSHPHLQQATKDIDYTANLNATTSTSGSAHASVSSTLRFPRYGVSSSLPTNYATTLIEPPELTQPVLADPFQTAWLPQRSEQDGELLAVRILGANVNYQLDAEDVEEVLRRLVMVRSVSLLPDDSSIAIACVAKGSAQKLVKALDGHRLHGVEGTLSITPLDYDLSVAAKSDLKQDDSSNIGTDLMNKEPILSDQHAGLECNEDILLRPNFGNSNSDILDMVLDRAVAIPRRATLDLLPAASPSREGADLFRSAASSSVPCGPIDSQDRPSEIPTSPDHYLCWILDLYQKSGGQKITTTDAKQTNYWSPISPLGCHEAKVGTMQHQQQPVGGKPRHVDSPFRTPGTSGNRSNRTNRGWSANKGSPRSPQGRRNSTKQTSPAEKKTSTGGDLISQQHDDITPSRNALDQEIDEYYGSHSGGRVRKWTARYDIQVDPDEQFQITRRIIGTRVKRSSQQTLLQGANMKKINQMTGAKLRLRGQGSGYLEGSSRQEAEDPLHLCISCCDPQKYKIAKQMTERLLSQIYSDYDSWTSEQGSVPPRLKVRSREIPRKNHPPSKNPFKF